MDSPKNLFDTIDDDMDIEEFSDRELNRYFDLGCLQPMMANMDEYDCKDDNVVDRSLTLQSTDVVLSQELNQLSTDSERTYKKRSLSTPSHSQSPPVKKQMINQNDTLTTYQQQDNIPEFIRLTYASFRQWIIDHDDIVNVLGLVHLQQLLSIQYRMEVHTIKKSIYQLHLKSGHGTLLNNNESNLFVDLEIDRSVWLRETLEALRHVSTDSYSCRQLIQQKIQETEKQMKLDRNQCLTIQDSHKPGLTSTMMETIRTYLVTHALDKLYWKRDFKIDLIYNEYRSSILERCLRHASNPTQEQIDQFKDLFQAKYAAERTRRDLIDLKQRIFYQKLPSNIESMDIEQQDQSFIPTYINEHEHCLQTYKLDKILGNIRQSEHVYWETNQEFERQYRRLTETMTSKLVMSIIDELLGQITNKLRRIYEYHTKQYLWNSNDDHKQCKTLQSSMIISVRHRFNNDQLKLLTRGPSYIPPCQLLTKMQSTTLSTDDYFKQQYAPMKNRLAHVFAKHKITIAGTLSMSQELQQKFREVFSVVLPTNIDQRSTYELLLIDEIRRFINEDQLVLRRTADNLNQFYLGDAHEFDSLCEEYLERMTFIRRLNDIDDIDDINRTIQTLYTNRIIPMDIVDRLTVDVNKVEYLLLYFLPDLSTLTRDSKISVSPRFFTNQCPTMKLASYLQSILRPFVDRIIQSKTFHSPLEFIEKLDYYGHTLNYFKTSTLFCRLSIRNFYHLVTHTTMIDIVECFIHEHSATNRLGNHSISTIQLFLRIFLTNNHFRYKNQLFTFAKGSPSSIPLSNTLSNIYIHSWQGLIENEIGLRDEFSGRYNDEMFFTWNRSRTDLEDLLKSIQKKQPSVEFDYRIDSKLSYLDAWIENRHGHLYTRTNGNMSRQRYILPYVRGHTKLQHSDWFRSALNRAVCYCSSVDDFHQERIRLELSLLTAGYSLMFVESHVHHFFQHFQGRTALRYRNDQNMYHSFRLQWFELTKRKFIETAHYRTMDDHSNVLRFEYFYDLGNRTKFNRFFLDLWTNYLEKQRGLSKDKFLVVISTQQRSSLNSLLARYRWFETIEHDQQ